VGAEVAAPRCGFEIEANGKSPVALETFDERATNVLDSGSTRCTLVKHVGEPRHRDHLQLAAFISEVNHERADDIVCVDVGDCPN
jgi:hypothetical protein